MTQNSSNVPQLALDAQNFSATDWIALIEKRLINREGYDSPPLSDPIPHFFFITLFAQLSPYAKSTFCDALITLLSQILRNARQQWSEAAIAGLLAIVDSAFQASPSKHQAISLLCRFASSYAPSTTIHQATIKALLELDYRSTEDFWLSISKHSPAIYAKYTFIALSRMNLDSAYRWLLLAPIDAQATSILDSTLPAMLAIHGEPLVKRAIMSHLHFAPSNLATDMLQILKHHRLDTSNDSPSTLEEWIEVIAASLWGESNVSPNNTVDLTSLSEYVLRAPATNGFYSALGTLLSRVVSGPLTNLSYVDRLLELIRSFPSIDLFSIVVQLGEFFTLNHARIPAALRSNAIDVLGHFPLTHITSSNDDTLTPHVLLYGRYLRLIRNSLRERDLAPFAFPQVLRTGAQRDLPPLIVEAIVHGGIHPSIVSQTTRQFLSQTEALQIIAETILYARESHPDVAATLMHAERTAFPELESTLPERSEEVLETEGILTNIDEEFDLLTAGVSD